MCPGDAETGAPAQRRDRCANGTPAPVPSARARRIDRDRAHGAPPPGHDGRARGHGRRRHVRAVAPGLRGRRGEGGGRRRTAPAQRAGLAPVHRRHGARARARRGHDRDPPRVPLRPGDRGPRGRARRPAREADGDERDRGRRAHPHPRPDRPPARGRVPGQPVAPRARRRGDAPVRRARGDPERERAGVAGLALLVAGDVAREPGAVGRRLHVRHRSPPAQHHRGPRRRGRRPGRRVAGGRRQPRGRPGRGDRAPGVRGADHDERLRPRDPVARLRHPPVLRARDAAHRHLGRAPGAPAARRGDAAPGSLGPSRAPCGSSSSTSGPGGWTTRARPRWASGWPGCGTPSASRRRAAAPWSARRARPTPHDGPGHRVERVPPGTDRRAGRADLPRRHPRRHRRGPAGRGRRPRRPDRDPRRARAGAARRRCSTGPTCSPGGATSPTTR